MVIDGFCKILLEIFAKMVYWERCFLETEVPVAQLDRVSASDAEGRGFESLRVRHKQMPPLQRVAFVYVEYRRIKYLIP